MRYKKIALVLSAVMIVSASLLGFAACNKKDTQKDDNLTSVLASDYNPPAKPKVKYVKLDDLKGYTLENRNSDGFIIGKKTYDNGLQNYILFNVPNAKTLVKSSRPITKAFDGMYYIVGDGPVKFYDKDGLVASEEGKYIISSEHRNVTLSDGRKISVVNGKTQIQDVSLDILPENLRQYQKIEDIYIASDEETQFVFDSSKKLMHTFSVNSLLHPSEISTVTAAMLPSVRVLFQITTPLDKDAQDYDYTDEDSVYSLATYLYDVKSDKLSPIDYDSVVVSDYHPNEINYSPYYAVLNTRKINKQKRLNAASLQIVGKDLDQIVDLDDYMRDCHTIRILDRGEVLVANESMTAIYKGKNKIASYINNPQFEYANSNLITDGINYFDIYGEKVFTLSGKNCARFFPTATTDGLVYFSREISDEENTPKIEYCVYDTKSKQQKSLGNVITVFDNTSYKIRNTQSNTVCLYHSYDGSPIFVDKDYSNINSYVIGKYTYISARTPDSGYDYYVYYLD